METLLWVKMHGATTHFPLALVLASGAMDGAAFVLTGRPLKDELRAAGYWTMIGGALGSVPAVLSGVLMTRGSVLGHGALRLHHLFVWPAFALLIALAIGRVVIGQRSTPRMAAGYLLGVGVAGALATAAGYWGGEMMMAR